MPFSRERRPDFFSTTALDLKWDAPDNSIGYEVNYREVDSTEWNSEVAQSPALEIKDLTICTAYEIRINSICINGQSGFPTESLIFETSCTVGNSQSAELDQGITIYPNPTSGQLNLKYDTKGYSEIQVAVQNAQGQIISERFNFEVAPGQNNLQLSNISEFNPGLYFVKIKQHEVVVMKKLIKL